MYCACTALQDLMAQYQELLQNLVTETGKKFKKRCLNSNYVNCQIKSWNSCTDFMPQFNCDSQFPTPQKCKNCHEPGAMISNISVVRFPNDFTTPDQSQREIICTTADLDQDFKKNIDKAGNKQLVWQYFGGNDGTFRIYPGFKWQRQSDKCKQYDPRLRPWYVRAMAGKKNLILVIDHSGSMNNSERMDLAKQAGKSVIGTLANTDWVGIVKFSSSAQSYQPNLVRADDENKNKIYKWIDSIDANGATNYKSAYDAATKLINVNIQDQFGKPDADWVIIFLSDGVPTKGSINSSAEMTKYYNEISNPKPIIFTFSLAPESSAKTEINKQAACDSRGIHKIISDNEAAAKLKDQMSGYYNYLIKKNKPQTPVWSQPYEDAFGLGLLTSVSMPVYFQDQLSNELVLGVAAIDVLYSDLTEKADNKTVNKTLVNRGTYTVGNMTDVQIQSLQGDDPYQQCITGKGKIANIESCQFNFKQQVFQQQNKGKSQSICCNSLGKFNTECNIAGVVIIIVIMVLGGIGTAIGIYCCYKKQKLCFQQEQDNPRGIYIFIGQRYQGNQYPQFGHNNPQQGVYNPQQGVYNPQGPQNPYGNPMYYNPNPMYNNPYPIYYPPQ